MIRRLTDVQHFFDLKVGDQLTYVSYQDLITKHLSEAYAIVEYIVPRGKVVTLEILKIDTSSVFNFKMVTKRVTESESIYSLVWRKKWNSHELHREIMQGSIFQIDKNNSLDFILEDE